VQVLKRPTTTDAGLWVATPKRIAKRAVDRNRVRRVLKAQWASYAPTQTAAVREWQRLQANKTLLVRLQALPKLPDGAFKRLIAQEFVLQLDALTRNTRATVPPLGGAGAS
jgi:RNase P protein component